MVPKFIDKRRVRIKVVIPSRDRKLTEWLTYAKKRVEPHWLDVIHKTGGGIQKARTWWLYFGVIPASDFAEVSLRREDGSYSPMTAADREEAGADSP